MSRVGKQPVPVPDKVQVQIASRKVTVSGPKGTLIFEHHPLIQVTFNEKVKNVAITRRDDSKFSRSLHGLTRAVVADMMVGVTSGFQKVVIIEDVGYAASLQGKTLVLNVGFAQPVKMPLPEGVQVQLPTAQRVVFSGADLQAVHDFAAHVRSIRKADPYHLKGMRYEGEVIRRKVGKAFASGPA